MTESSMSGLTPDPRAWTGARAFAAWGVLTLALLLAFLSIWVLVPAPVSAFLPFAVVVPELSPLLSLVALTLAACAWLRRAHPPVRAAA
ncbi:MAG TPA: hypothetical protein VGQ37_27470, partial [Vicinamibacterales bacterium]|nr:hypothetical protein [Vicinamibacterales bacterium]